MAPARGKTFAITGVAGFVARRHLEAIVRVGGRPTAALDPRDAVGLLDEFDLELPFFTDAEAFEHFLRSRGALDYLTVCSPNDVHRDHCSLGLSLGADVICEKPVALDPRTLDDLERLESDCGGRIWTILQLRADPDLQRLRHDIVTRRVDARAKVVITYVSARGPWYDASWKGDDERSGGITTNIGVHMFDVLLWLFGPARRSTVHLLERRRAAGTLELESADVAWFLSVDATDLGRAGGSSTRRAIRELVVGDRRVDLSATDGLHNRVYDQTVRGAGYGLGDARPSIELAYRLRRSPIATPRRSAHPLLDP